VQTKNELSTTVVDQQGDEQDEEVPHRHAPVQSIPEERRQCHHALAQHHNKHQQGHISMRISHQLS